MDEGVFAIYSRKSRFTGKGESVENQIGLCRGYLTAHFGPEASDRAAVYEDEGFSGGTLDRPQFKMMMSDAQKSPFLAIVVYRLDRISRSIGDFAGLIEELGRRGIGFISIREQFDTSSPMGRAMMYIASVFSQLERETIAERIRDNMRLLARTGRWLGGVTPTGYRSERVTGKGPDGRARSLSRLILEPGEAEMVGEIFRLFLATGSLTGTDAELLRRGAVTRTGKPFSRVAIRAILTNPVYAAADGWTWEYFSARGADLCSPRESFDGEHGVMAYNRTLQTPGKGAVIRQMSDWVVAVGEHPGIVTGDVWTRVQDMLERRAVTGRGRPRSRAALLSGLLRCGCCGGFMRPKLTSGDGQKYIYICETRERSRGALCRMGSLPGAEADRAVLEAAGRLSGQGREALAAMLEAADRGRGGDGDGLRALRERIRENEREIENALNAITGGSGPAEEYLLERINRLHAEGGALRRRLLELEKAADETGGAKELLSFPAALASCGIPERREALRAVIGRVEWDGEALTVYFRGAGKEKYSGTEVAEKGENSDPPTSSGTLCKDSK